MRMITTSRGKDFTIGQLSRLTGVNIETIRYYEHVKLLPKQPRTVGGRRIYDPTHPPLRCHRGKSSFELGGYARVELVKLQLKRLGDTTHLRQDGFVHAKKRTWYSKKGLFAIFKMGQILFIFCA